MLYICEICGIELATKYSLNRHSQMIHNVGDTYPCPYCDNRFCRNDARTRHIDRVHTKQRGGALSQGLWEPPDGGVAPPPADDINDNATNDIIRRYWMAMQTRWRMHAQYDTANIRLWDGTIANDYNAPIRETLITIWHRLHSRIKINCSVGIILQHRVTGELRYYHASSNNATLFDNPATITTQEELTLFIDRYLDIDVVARAVQQRPTTSWVVKHVTNVTFYLYKLVGMGRIGNAPALPSHIVCNKAMLSMNKNPKTGVQYADQLCFFRCLAVLKSCRCLTQCKCSHTNESQAKSFFHQWSLHKYKKTIPALTYGGVSFTDMLELETLFDISIVVFQLSESRTSEIVWNSGKTSKSKLRINLQNGHFSYIKNVDLFAKSYSCGSCETTFNRVWNLQRHKCEVGKITNIRFPGGSFSAPRTVFDILREDVGIDTSPTEGGNFFPHYTTYDIECSLSPVQDPNNPNSTNTTIYTSQHKLLSIATASNVPGYEKAQCFVSQGDAEECVQRFVKHISDVADASEAIVRENYAPVYERLDAALLDRESREEEYSTSHFSNPRHYGARKDFSNIRQRLDHWVENMPVLGFNSQKYDLKILQGPLVKCLRIAIEKERSTNLPRNDEGVESDSDTVADEYETVGATRKRRKKRSFIRSKTNPFNFVVKQANKLTCMETRKFRFLDISNFLAANSSYASYLKAYNCDLHKGCFPYEWMDSIDKLNHRELPPHSAFYSSLSRSNISKVEYEECQQVWASNNMKTFRDYLVHYNILDVLPFLQAIDRQTEVYRERGIDMLKDAISLPSVAVKWLFTEIDKKPPKFPHEIIQHWSSKNQTEALITRFQESQAISLLDEQNQDLYNKAKKDLTGGPSIVFHRRHIANETKLRENEYLSDAKTCKEILGIDANALYLSAMSEHLPTGYPIRRHSDNGFKPKRPKGLSKVAHGWLEYESYRSNTLISHAHNGGEVKIGQHGLPVDGYCKDTRTIYQFHGCYWHAHPCDRNRSTFDSTYHPTRKRSLQQILEETESKDQYLKDLGYVVVVVWECEWATFVNDNKDAKYFLKVMFLTLYGNPKGYSQKEMLEAIENGKVYGLVECDLEVPDHLQRKFAEMPPIFKNVELNREALSPHMREFAEREGFMKTKQRLLVGSTFGKNILLLSTLLRWYIQQGLVVTKIYQVSQFTPRKVFEQFGLSVTKARREGDSDPSKAILANNCKSVGNSVFGKTCANKHKHRSVNYVEGAEEASKMIRRRTFESLEEISPNIYEISSFKKQICIDIPLTVGFTILQLAKLRMLEFYYDFMDRFFDRRDFELVESDTDSLYMALSGPLIQIVRKSLLDIYFEEYSKWFPRQSCEDHHQLYIETCKNNGEWVKDSCCQKVHKHDCRTPGLFKEEFKGDGIIALNSKTYFCWVNDTDGKECDIKYSSKGLSKRTNKLTKEVFDRVLTTQKSHVGVNTGFRMLNGNMYTYSQNRAGLTYFYAKREVSDNGVSTTNIKL